ncbi:MAG: DNA primase [Elusimicrobia bacterium]|nr:DNA primase [Elusimicrobiota bacterium]
MAIVSAETIRESVDIVEVVKEYVPSLKKSGKSYKGKCPFHDEKTASFFVQPDKQMFYCFGCQTGGDVFTFLMKIENLSFGEAAQKLAQRAGIEWRPAETLGPQEKEKSELRAALEFAKNFYRKALSESPDATPAREYLSKRNVPKSGIERFELGWSPDEGNALLTAAQKEGHRREILFKAGLISGESNSPYDYFRGRLMFPILNHRSETVGFGGRVLGGGEPKYLNSPETPVFSKGKVLYGLVYGGPAIRKAEKALLLEGYMDVIACHEAGLNYCAAPLGTAVNEGHAKLLKRYCQSVVLLFDPDPSGVKASLKTAQLLTECGMFVSVAELDEGLDPDEYLAKHGAFALEEKILKAKSLVQFHADMILSEMPSPLSARDKSKAAGALAETISRQRDEIIRAEWVKYGAERISVGEGALLNLVKKNKLAGVGEPAGQSAEPDISILERDLIKWLLKFPAHVQACRELESADFESADAWDILSEIRANFNLGTDGAEISAVAARKLPKLSDWIAKISVEAVPSHFSAEKDIASAAVKIKRVGMERRLLEIRKEKARLIELGQDTHGILMEEAALGKFLKSSKLSNQP